MISSSEAVEITKNAHERNVADIHRQIDNLIRTEAYEGGHYVKYSVNGMSYNRVRSDIIDPLMDKGFKVSLDSGDSGIHFSKIIRIDWGEQAIAKAKGE